MTKKNNNKSNESLRFAVLAADTVLFTVFNGELLVRLTQVHRPPYFVNAKGLPGGLLSPKETAEEAAKRHIEEKAGVGAKKIHLEQLYTFSEVRRDPRGRVVAVAYLGLVPWEKLTEKERQNKNATWVPVRQMLKLAYDHDRILTVALARLRSRIKYTTLISKLTPKVFTLTELEQTYSAILKTNIDKRNFRKKIMKVKVLKLLPYKRSGNKFRPARLYSFKSKRVDDIEVL